MSGSGRRVCAAPQPNGLSVNVSPSRLLTLPEPQFLQLYACLHAHSIHSYLTLCDLMDCSPPGSSVHGISQAKILEWVASSFSRGSLELRDQTCASYVSFIDRHVLYH